ncbi:hypothetical protein [Acuticoccus kandeliae]|uniref:hypothetical protein n=1 Tax=Acuticoccus kandeliae TaxID=2073160 RepID=UPI000D3E081F|nr:hypothetical protein [Acuticoccus kandeliae]
MASRAFFRCRACGEPVVAGAYRCPVCGIDFPTGTPGTPNAPDSPAAVDPTRKQDRRTAEFNVDNLAEHLRGALDDELSVVPGRERETEREAEPAPPSPPKPAAAAPTPEPEPERHDRRREPAFGAPSEPEPAHYDADEDEDFDDEDEAHEHEASTLNAPRAPVGERRGRHRERDVGGLTVTPARERDRASRERRVVIAERVPPASSSRELTTRPRRSKRRSLTGTAMLALVMIVVVGAGAWWVDRTGIADLGLRGRIASGISSGPQGIEVRAADGWVSVPGGVGTMVVSADGPFRVRLNGEVYTVDGTQQALQVPVTDTTSLSVRVVREPTVVRVAPLP